MVGHRVAVVVPRTFSLFEVGIAIEAFTYPTLDAPGAPLYDVRACTAAPVLATAKGGVMTAGITDGLHALETADTVLVPQAASVHSPAEPEVIDAVRRAYHRGARVAAFNSGVYVLAAAGILDGRRVACHWQHATEFARAYPAVKVDPSVLYVDDGNVLTSAGAGASLDLALHIIMKDHGVSVARQVAQQMVACPHRSAEQSQFIVSPVPATSGDDDGIRRAISYALTHLGEEIGLTEMASVAYMSTRHFSRKFREATGSTPVKWLTYQRLVLACQLLEQTSLPVERIALESGFRSSVTFRQRFAQQFGTSPMAYRKSFRAPLDSDRMAG
jgi:AraC family transcriptional activator FtrA